MIKIFEKPKNKKNNSKLKKQNSGDGKANSVGLMSGIMVFKPFHPTPVYSKLFRYKIPTAIVGQVVTMNNIFAAWVVAQSTTVGRALISTMRIRRVTAIATALSATVDEELYIRDASLYGPVDPVDSTSTGQGNAIATWKPKAKSLAGDWFQYTTGASCFQYSLPAGATLEIDIDFVVSGAAGTALTTTYTLAGATTGTWYSMGLDGSAGSIYYSAIGMNNA